MIFFESITIPDQNQNNFYCLRKHLKRENAKWKRKIFAYICIAPTHVYLLGMNQIDNSVFFVCCHKQNQIKPTNQ